MRWPAPDEASVSTAVSVALAGSLLPPAAQQTPMPPTSANSLRSILQWLAITRTLKTAGLIARTSWIRRIAAANPETWEKVVRKLRAGMMPPSGVPRPERAALDAFVGEARNRARPARPPRKPNPGTTGLHRLNRTEYAQRRSRPARHRRGCRHLLPADDSSEGFDNIADALGVSPALIERYVGRGHEDQPPGRRRSSHQPVHGHLARSRRPLADAITSKACRWEPAAEFSFATHFPLDAEYAFKIRASSAGLGVGAGGGARDDWKSPSTASAYQAGQERLDRSAAAIKAGPQTIGVAYARTQSRRRGRLSGDLRRQLGRAAVSRSPVR